MKTNFNKLNKVGYKQLNPPLQNMLDQFRTDIDGLRVDVNTVINLINGVRITIGLTPPANPKNGKELWINPTTCLIQQYIEGSWVENNANLSKNIPKKDVGGNIWIEDN